MIAAAPQLISGRFAGQIGRGPAIRPRLRMGILATFDFDAAEHYRATRAVTRHTPQRFVAWGFAAFALGLVAWNVVPRWGDVEPLPLFWSSLPWLLLTAFWFAFLPFSQWRAARRLPERDPSARGTQERAVDDVGYHSRGNGVAVDVPWHAMHRVIETAEFFLFFYNKQWAYYVPKRALTTAAVAELRALTQAKLEARALLLAT